MNWKILGVVAFATLATCAYAENWYVDASKAAGSGDGKSPSTAFHTIQEAVDAASADDTVVVAEGVYADGETNVWTYTHGGSSHQQQTRVLVTKTLNIVASGEKTKTVILGSEGTPEKSTKDTSRWYRSDSVTCMIVGSGITGVTVKGFTFEHGFAHQSAGGGSLAAGGLACYATGNGKSFQDAFTAINCDFVDCFGRGAGGINGGTAIRCSFRGGMSNYRATAAFRSRLFNCIVYDGRLDAGSVPDIVNCIVINCTVINNFGTFGIGKSTNGVEMPDGFATAYNTVCYVNATRYQDAMDVKSSGLAHNVVCDLNQDASKTGSSFEEGSTHVVYLKSTLEDMTSACVCPATLDLHPVKGGCLDAAGDLELVRAFDFIPEDEMRRDFYGKPFDGMLPIGAILPSADVKSGVMTLASHKFNVNGRDLCVKPAYIQSEFWPAQVKLCGSTRENYKFLGTQGPFKSFCGIYDYVLQSLPPKNNADGSPFALANVNLLQFSDEFYVGNATGQENASDSNAGTAEAPFKTISRAIAAMPVQADGSYLRTLIHVRPGTYSIANGESGGYWSSLENVKGVVCVPAKHHAVVVADEGPGVTFIEGQPDPDTLNEEALPGCGPKAYRCVVLDTSAECVVAGFTFRNGYSSSREITTTASVEAFGSGVLAGGISQSILDCVITGCHGNFAAYRGVYGRCVFKANVDCLSGVGCGEAVFASCVFDGNVTTAARVLYDNCKTINCSFYECNCALGCYVQRSSNGWMVNCAVDTTGTMQDFSPGGNPCVGSIVHAANDLLVSCPVIKADPYFTAPWNGDCRIHEPSLAVGVGVSLDPYCKILTSDLVRFVAADFYGMPLAKEGLINAGAIAETTPASDVYVDAINGNDANDGLSVSTAKKTLQAAVGVRAPGNCAVVALPGVYKEGSSVHIGRAFNGNDQGKAQPTIRCRVVVPEGKMLISRDGPKVTVIEGEPDQGSSDAYGRGPNAIRGVFLDLNAKLRGFTVCNGRSDYYRKGDGSGDTHDTRYQDDLFAGGILGRHGAAGGAQLGGAIVEDCIITGNYAENGGAGCLVSFRNCTVTNNVAASFGGFFRHGEAYNCYVARNNGPRVMDCVFNLVNCTFEDNFDVDGVKPTQLIGNMVDNGKLWNLVNIATAVEDAFKKGDIRNVVFSKGTDLGFDVSVSGVNVNTNLTYGELKEMFVDGYPMALSAPTVDQGLADAGAALSDKDVAGAFRVQNGMIDIGAFEADWKSAYSKAIGRRVVVMSASSSIKMTDGHPLMRDDDRLAATVVAGSSASIGYVVRVKLVDSGKMIVRLNGLLLGELTASGELRFENDFAENQLEFVYTGEGSAYVAKVAQESGMVIVVH